MRISPHSTGPSEGTATILAALGMTSLLACASDWAFGHVADPPPSPEAPVSITLDRTTYRPGDLARLTVLNEAGMPIRYDICLRHLDGADCGNLAVLLPRQA